MNDIRERMQETGRYIATILPPNTGFILLAFDFEGKPNESKMEYISNGVREDVVKAMKEFIAKNEAGWGKHLP
jgi:hypothetical protein